MYSLRRIEGWYDGRRVASGSTPPNPSSVRSRPSTRTSMTRTGLSSPIQSSTHSGNSVLCPRSAPSIKRFIRAPGKSCGNHIARITSSAAFSHSQGQTRKSGDTIATSALPPTADIPASGCDVRKVPDSDIGPRFMGLAFLRRVHPRQTEAAPADAQEHAKTDFQIPTPVVLQDNAGPNSHGRFFSSSRWRHIGKIGSLFSCAFRDHEPGKRILGKLLQDVTIGTLCGRKISGLELLRGVPGHR